MKFTSIFFLKTFVLADMIGVGMVLPVLPELALHLGVTPVQFGLIGTFYGIGQLIGGPFSGFLSDKYGRKQVLIFSFLCCFISYGVMAILTTFEALLICRVIVGLGKQTMSISQAYITDLTSKEERMSSIAQLSTIYGIGFIIGPILGSLLSSYHLRTPFYAASILFGLTTLLSTKFLPESTVATVTTENNSPAPPPPPSSFMSKLQYFWEVFRSPIGKLLMVKFVFAAIHLIYQDTFLLFAKSRFGFNNQSNGPLLSYIGILSVLSQGAGVPFFNKFLDEKHIALGSVLVVSFSTLAIASITDLFAFLIATGFVSLGVNLTRTSLTSIYSQMVPQDKRGTYFGFASSLESIHRVVIPTLSGILLQTNESAPLLVASIGALLLFLYLLRFPIEKENEKID